uniref:Retrovirus-related Pol polyprotein from transposon TNT 1-94 n=1 Tax=Lygus hesperus TaxID=30085 RepID=A0A0A9WBY3_LYGHE
MDSIRDELNSLESNGTWQYVPKSELDSGTKIIKARWVHKRKLEPDGNYRYKSRLVARGFADTNHYEVNEIYAPVARLSDVRLVLSIANKFDLELHQLDVKTAFLYRELDSCIHGGS